MKSIQMSGKTVEEAVHNALKELNVTKDKVDIKIIDEGSKGLFKLFKGKDAIVEVTLKNDYMEDARKFLREILNAMGILAEIKIKENDDIVNINLIGPNMGLIIGHRGETLDSLQYLVSLVINKNNDGKYKKVILDTENY
jgi:spoIIIJ-associated protein